MNKQIIYSNSVSSRYDYLKERQNNGEEGLVGLPDGDLWALASDLVDADLKDEMENLSKKPGGEICIKGTLETWNGLP